MIMNVAEMKIEVINKITYVNNENVLKEVLALLENAMENEKDNVSMSKNYEAIKDQYGDVLQKLAQW